MTKRKRTASIRWNMIVYSMSIIVLMAILSIYAISIMNRYKEQMETMFEKHIYLSDVEATIERMDQNLLGFLNTKSSTKLNDYLIDLDKLKNMMAPIVEVAYTNEDIVMNNIVNLTYAYDNSGQEAIAHKRLRDVAGYNYYYDESLKIKGFVIDYIDELNNNQLTRNSKTYLGLVEQIQWLQTLTVLIVIDLIVLSLLIVYLITQKMVKPISNLSSAAEEIAKGNLSTEDIIVDTEDEWMLLANTFNKMKNSIGSYVEELQTKAQMETALKDEQLKNIRMAHNLDKAKLYALQSQINPHFLFNTINAGVQMSIMERAPKTGQFLDTMSSLFRYNIQQMDSETTIGEEVKNIEDYYNLLKVRFGTRIQFHFIIDDKVKTMKVPPLILQPLVENAYIHGLSDIEEGGTITLTVYQDNEKVTIVIKDNGKGMDKKTIDRIMMKKEREEITESTGIGVRNVIDRLELFFHRKDVFRIESQPDRGTKIIITLPLLEKI